MDQQNEEDSTEVNKVYEVREKALDDMKPYSIDGSEEKIIEGKHIIAHDYVFKLILKL